jgi:Tol biopolymer transport system component
VFSAHIDPATLSPSSFGLLRGGTPVPGSVRPAGTNGISAEFYPDSALAPVTSYQLFVTQAIHDVNGVPLSQAVTETFATGSTTQEYAVGGSVNGLAGTGLVLDLNNIETLPVAANGSFVFSTTLAQGAAVNITVHALPSSPSQICTVSGGSSVVANGPDMNAVIGCSSVIDGATGKILFTSTNGGTVSHIFALDLDHSTIVPLTSGAADDHSPRWSPDHTKIAFVRSGGASTTGVWLMNADGSQQARVSPVGYGGIAWSPDGTRLLVTSGDTVRTVNADGSGTADVGIMSTSPGTVCLADPAWSPDGATIAGSCTTDQGDAGAFTQAYLMNPNGSNLRRLSNPQTYGSENSATSYAEGEPTWSPNGLQVAFWSFAMGVTVANPDGSNAFSVTGDTPPRIPSVGFGASPDWSPDGKSIVYRNSNGQLVITASSGDGTPVTVTSITGGASSPAWSR